MLVFNNICGYIPAYLVVKNKIILKSIFWVITYTVVRQRDAQCHTIQHFTIPSLGDSKKILFAYILQCTFNTVNFLPSPHSRHSISCPYRQQAIAQTKMSDTTMTATRTPTRPQWVNSRNNPVMRSMWRFLVVKCWCKINVLFLEPTHLGSFCGCTQPMRGDVTM